VSPAQNGFAAGSIRKERQQYDNTKPAAVLVTETREDIRIVDGFRNGTQSMHDSTSPCLFFNERHQQHAGEL